jgi:hypothetical protein
VKKIDDYMRSFILALGVCVALAIALTLWTSQRDKSAAADVGSPRLSLPVFSSLITKSITVAVQTVEENRNRSATH